MISASFDRFSEDIRVLAVVIAELEFRDVEREIFGADFVERADDTALDEGPEALNRVRVNRSDNVLPHRMLDDGVRVFLVQTVVTAPLIRAEKANLGRYGFAHERAQRFALHVFDDASNDTAFAADSADHRDFAGARTATARAIPISSLAAPVAFVPVLGLAANESLIDFDDTHQLVELLIGQASPDPVAHMPRGTVRAETHHAMDLKGADAFLASEHQMDNAEPLPQGLIRVLEDRTGNVGKAVGDAASTIHALPFPSHGFELVNPLAATARARHTFWPAMRDKVSAAGVFVRESRFPLGEGHLMDRLGLFRAGHIGSPDFVRGA